MSGFRACGVQDGMHCSRLPLEVTAMTTALQLLWRAPHTLLWRWWPQRRRPLRPSMLRAAVALHQGRSQPQRYRLRTRPYAAVVLVVEPPLTPRA